MLFSIMEERIRRCVEETGEYPQQIGVTREQMTGMIAGIPFSIAKDLEPDSVNKFMGVPIVVVEVIGTGESRRFMMNKISEKELLDQMPEDVRADYEAKLKEQVRQMKEPVMEIDEHGHELHETGYIPVVEVPALKFWKNMADRRLDLLVECAQLLSFKVIDEIAAGDLIEKIEEEIGSKIDLS